MTDKLDLSRPVQVKGGGTARYLGSIESFSVEPHVFAVRHIEGFEVCVQSDDFGRSLTRAITIINVPEPKRSGEVWVNINIQGEVPGALSYDTRKLADDCAGLARIACIGPIKWTEGDGLENKESGQL